MKSLAKLSILLEIVVFLIATPAIAMSITEYDEFYTLPENDQAQTMDENSEDNSIDVTVELQSEEESMESLEVVLESESEEEIFETAAVMSTEDLEENRGAFAPVNTSYLLATSSNNSVANSVTGGNVIADGAFNSSSGLVNVIQNSGNNVLIQSSTIVNVEMNN